MDPTSSTNFPQLNVAHATVVQTECEANILRLGLALTLSNPNPKQLACVLLNLKSVSSPFFINTQKRKVFRGAML